MQDATLDASHQTKTEVHYASVFLLKDIDTKRGCSCETPPIHKIVEQVLFFARIAKKQVQHENSLVTQQLLVLTSLEAHYLVTSKETPSTTLEILLCESCVVYTIKLLNGVAEVLEHTTHDTVTA
jgi:hypothetical protein